jgi:hypothetical protein
VQLPLVDASGRAVRGAFGREAAGAGTAPNAGKRAGTKAPQRYNRETGEKERYFADDDKVCVCVGVGVCVCLLRVRAAVVQPTVVCYRMCELSCVNVA